MEQVIVLEFASPEAVELYNSVNAILAGDSGDWQLPHGMISHLAGEAGDKLIVVELWESQAHQQAFMENTLGPALHQANVPAPTRVEWFNHAGDRHTHRH